MPHRSAHVGAGRHGRRVGALYRRVIVRSRPPAPSGRSPRPGVVRTGVGPARSRRPPPPSVYQRRRLTAVFVAIVVFGSLAVIEWEGGPTKVRALLHRSSSAAASEVAVDPSAFAPTACEAFAPTRGNRHETVFLDAGHGGLDPGATGVTESGATIYEADETLPVALDATALLRAAGFRVVDSRTEDTNVARLGPADVDGTVLTDQGVHDDVAARDVCANDAGADLLVGIYFDSGASESNAGAVTGYDAVRSFAAQNLRFANLLQNDVLAAMNAQGWQIPNEGVVLDGNLGSASSQTAINYGHLLLLGPADPGWFDTPSRMPGALIEPLFITDPFEGSIAASSQGHEVIAQGIAQAVEAYFAPIPPASTPATSVSSG